MSHLDHERALEQLDHELGRLKLAYDQYFLGSLPREPLALRSGFDRALRNVAGRRMQNTGLRFRRSGISARYQALNRQWNETLRKIEHGSYIRHLFKAQLHGSAMGAACSPDSRETTAREIDSLVAAVQDAQRSCSGPSAPPSRAKLSQWVVDQREALRQRHGDVEVRFRVVVSEGRIKLQAARVAR